MNIHAFARYAHVVLAAGLLALVATAAPLSAAPVTIAPVLSCPSLAGLSLANTLILSATELPTPVPHCAVIGIINERVSTQDPDHFTYAIGLSGRRHTSAVPVSPADTIQGSGQQSERG
jgi:hypothetical protein